MKCKNITLWRYFTNCHILHSGISADVPQEDYPCTTTCQRHRVVHGVVLKWDIKLIYHCKVWDNDFVIQGNRTKRKKYSSPRSTPFCWFSLFTSKRKVMWSKSRSLIGWESQVTKNMCFWANQEPSFSCHLKSKQTRWGRRGTWLFLLKVHRLISYDLLTNEILTTSAPVLQHIDRTWRWWLPWYG